DATVRIASLRIAESSADAFGIAERVRSAADAALARVLPEPMAGLASGILVGRRDRVSREVADSFTTTGLSHVVAISGWNICLLGAVIGGLLSAMGVARRRRTVAIVVALAGFTLLAGGGASVVRAALMGGVALIARETGRPGSAAAALGLAVWSLLLLDPAISLDIGFQLSVCATAGLLAWGSRLTRCLRGADPGRARRWLAESLGVSLAAQAATLPLVLFHFGQLSLVSPVANLIIGPIVAPAMLVATIALVAGLAVGAGLPFVVGAPFALLGWLVLGAMVAVSGILGQVPLASVELPPVSAMLLAAAVALGIGAVAWRAHGSAPPEPSRPTVGRPTAARPTPSTTTRWRPRPALVIFVAVVATLASLGVVAATRSGPGRLSVTVLDVGQGDAILVEGPRGGRILLDSGPDPDRLLTVLDRHVPAWDRRIDLVILTHPHEDHVAGLATLVGRYRVAAIAENGMLGAGPGDAAFRAWLATTGRTTHKLGAGDRLSFDGVAVDVRWPIPAEVPARSPSVGRQVNDTSVVLDLRYGERRMLLTGDIEDDVDPRLLESGIGGAAADRLDVLKVAHHGSRRATSEPWLAALKPRVAMISAGTGNSYGHPAPETVARLLEHGARVLRTDLTATSRSVRMDTTCDPPPAADDPSHWRSAAGRWGAGRVWASRAHGSCVPSRGRRRASRPSRSHPRGTRRGVDRCQPDPDRPLRHLRTARPWASAPPLATIGSTMVPSPAAAAALLLSLTPRTWLRRHACAVADVASFLALATIRAGHRVDQQVVETAALLHDLDKALPPDAPLRALGHGHAGARWLVERDFAELAPAVATHPAGRLTEMSYADWGGTTTIEQRLVAYADKRAQQRLVSLDQRYARWTRRHPEQQPLLVVSRARAAQLEAEICGLAGIGPEDVARHRWAAVACREAALPSSAAAAVIGSRPSRTSGVTTPGASTGRRATSPRPGPMPTGRHSRRGVHPWMTMQANPSRVPAARGARDSWTTSACDSRRPPCSVAAAWSWSVSRARCCASRPPGSGPLPC
ncbi:MAG: DNA internalization-related competence protein ComEC/Rec2, partial [Chloroflexi bacterium]|nr:DNA internalization-related competence protein ComEC/Rec2 [Chloroflexota bacterium]